jgi:hypothetical protein
MSRVAANIRSNSVCRMSPDRSTTTRVCGVQQGRSLSISAGISPCIRETGSTCPLLSEYVVKLKTLAINFRIDFCSCLGSIYCVKPLVGNTLKYETPCSHCKKKICHAEETCVQACKPTILADGFCFPERSEQCLP